MSNLGQIIRKSNPSAVVFTLALLWAASTSSPSTAADFSGRVVRVIDGDTIEVLVDRRPVRVRLAWIDAPERGQAFGQVSRKALEASVAGRQVLVLDQGFDQYGRVVGRVRLDGVDVNARQVQAGMAWVSRKYSRDPMLTVYETKARFLKVGLWIDPRPVAPWDYRRQQKG